MSDLQCPARILLIHHDAEVMVGALSRARVLHVYSGADPAAAAIAERLAVGLGVAGTRWAEGTGAPAGSCIAREVLEDLADRHRGETVVVVSHGGAILATLAALGWPGLAADLGPGAGVVLERDGDGWRHTGTV